jgi:parallel beta-helix repeat protein/VCBS repeat-containing protein
MTSGAYPKAKRVGGVTSTAARQRASVAPSRQSPRTGIALRAPFPLKPLLETLEPRLLLSADAFPIAPDLAFAADAPANSTAIVAPSETAQTTAAALSSSRELVFVDPRVPDSRQLLQTLLGEAEDGRRFEIITLDANRDGIVQVTAALKSRMQIDAVHFITHGSDGAIQLGGTLLDAKALAANLDMVGSWSSSLKANADLLFYGCDLAASARGRALIDWLADVTGADVAASIDPTGSAAKGGDWSLEYRVGTVETSVLASLPAHGEWDHLLNTYVVSNTNNSGAGSFRQAILDANANSPAADTIQFNLLTSDPNYNTVTGVWTINIASALDPITGPTLIDGWSQAGWADRPLVELNGALTNPSTDGLVFTAGTSEVRGLIIDLFGVGGGAGNGGSGIIADGSSQLTIRGNYIGTDATGTLDRGNGDYGIKLLSDDNVVGGTNPTDRNVISGNDQDGIYILGSTGNVVRGNYIGTTKDGTAALGNGGTGVWVRNASGNTIGGTGLDDRNVISGNGFASTWQGVLLQNSDSNFVQGNYIGTNALGSAALANAGPGIEINNGSDNNQVSGNVISGNTYDGVVIWQSTGNTIRSNIIGANAGGTGPLGNGDNGVWITDAAGNTVGGPNSGDGNVITANGYRLSGSGYLLSGIEIDGNGSTNNAILGNRIYENAGLGIDLNISGSSGLGDGVTPNDPDPGTGPNRRQNYPVLTAAVTNGATNVQISGSLNSTANTNFRVEVFASGTVDGSGHGEGDRYLGSFDVTTDGTGNGSFSEIVSAAVGAGEAVSATATNLATNETSEFAASVAAVNNMPPIANDVLPNGSEDDPSIAVTLSGTDPEGPIASFRLTSLPANGTLYVDPGLGTAATAGVDYAATGNALTLYFKPAANWNGTTGFQFTAVDLLGAPAVAPANATINVAAVNDPGSVNVTGTPTEDQTLTAGVSDPDGVSGGVSYQWQRFDGSAWNDIAGANLNTYTLGDADVGRDVRLSASYTDDQGTAENVVSAPVGPVVNVNDPGTVTITGTPTEDQVLNTNVADADGTTGPISYQWERSMDGGASWAPIAGATAANYTLDDADVGTLVRVAASYTDDQSTAENQVSSEVGPIANVNDAPIAGDDGGYAVDEDAALPLTVGAAAGVLGNDSDIDSAPLTAVLVAGPANAAAFSLNADGSFGYAPRADFYGTDTFTYQAFDGSAASNIATVTITVNPVADHVMVVDTAADTVDGDVTSIDALLRDKGADGFVSLREAILAANATANAGGPDRINFDIAGPQTINVLSALPVIWDAVIIDGTTDPDFSGAPVIELNGAGAGAGAHGLTITAGGSTVRGLVINRFDQDGISVSGGGGNSIVANYVGTNAAGTAANGNGGYGIRLASDNNVIGGMNASDRNVVSGSGIDGIFVDGSTGNVIQGNYIGTNAAGTAALGNTEDGIWLQNASNNTIGGTVGGAGNLISGNNWSGIAFTGGGSDNLIQGNAIGVNATGTGALGNLRHGVQFLGASGTTIGGTATTAGNVISNNGLDGVSIEAGTGQRVLGNAIYGNGGLGIDIGNDGVTANDPGDADLGTNLGMNAPVIYSVLLAGGNVTVAGEARPGAIVQIFEAAADPSGRGEGETFLYSATVTGATPGLVDPTAVQFSFTFAAGSVAAGDQITATATDTGWNTSEFAANAFANTSLPGITVTPTSGLVTTEGGGTATFSVVLASQPNADVTIALASDNTAEGTVAPAPLVFTSANWNVVQTVTVTGVADFVTDGSAAYSIVLSAATSTDAGYNGIDPADVSVTNMDGTNDAPVNNVPGTQIGAEDTPLVFSTVTGNRIWTSDSDVGPGLLEVTLTATQGTLTLAGGTGLTFTVGTGTGEATMTFTGTLADINAALDGLSFAPTPGYSGLASLSIASNDLGGSGAGGPQGASDTIDITVVAVNDAPTIDLDADDSSGATGANFQRSYSEQSSPRLIIDATDAVLGDVDSANLASLTVTISNLLDVGAEWLSADTSSTPLITSTYNPVTGVLILNGADTVANYQQVLRTVRYENTSDAPRATPRVITFVASDGGAASTAAIATVTINPVNDAPVADMAAPSYAAVENSGPLVLHGTGMSVDDIDALPTSIVDVYLSSISGLLYATQGNSSVTITGSGSPNLTFTGTIARINALLAGTTTGTVTYVVGSDSPAPTDTLSLAIDDNGATGAGGAQWGWDSATVDLTAINDAPVNTLPSGSTPENTPLVFSTANGNQIYVTDVDAGAALVSVTLNVTNGTLSLNAAAIGGLGTLSGDGTASITATGTVANINAALDGLTFTPNAGFNGAALLTLSTSDQGASGSEVPPVPLSDADLATITVTPVNDAPAGTDNTVTTLEGAEYTFTLAAFGFTDPDLGDSMSEVRIDSLPAPAIGTLTLFGVGPVAVNDLISAADITAGNLRFTPAPTVTGSTAFSFSVRDLAGAFDPTPNTMTVDVTPAGVPGVTVTPTSGLVTTESGGAATFSVVLDTQPTSSVTITLSSSNTAEGTVSPTSLVFTDSDWDTPQFVTVTGVPDAVPDGNVAYTIVLDVASSADPSYDGLDPADVSVTNTEANSAPTVTVPAGYSAIEGSPLTITGPGLSVADADAGASIATVTLSVNAGILTVVPGSTGVTPVVPTGASVTLTGTIVQINNLLANSGGTVTYVTGSDSPPVSDSLTVSINDNHPSDPRSASASTTIAITPVNDAPVNTLPGGATAFEDTPLMYAGASQISITDVDAGGLPLQVALNASNGVMTLGGIAGLTFTSGNGTLDTSMTFTGTVAAINAALNGLTFTPDLNYWGSAFITMTTSDLGASGAGGAQTDTDLATIDVLPVNDAPDGTDTTVTAIEDTPYTFTLGNFGFNDVDSIDGDMMTAVRIDSVTLPAGATLQLSGVDIDVVGMTNNTVAVADIVAGNLVFTPVPDANGPNYASFTFSVADFGVPPGSLFDLVPNRMTINVAPVNDAPVITSHAGAASVALTQAENGTAVATVTAGDIDLPPQTLTYSISGGADAALFTVNATTGVLAFASAPNFEAPSDVGIDNVYDVTVRVSDGSGGSDTQAFSITVTDADDAPLALDDGYTMNEDTALTVPGPGTLGNDYDEDGSPVTAALVSGPTYGSLAFNADGSFVYTPNANFFGTDTFVYRVSDGALQSGSATVTITVNGVQDEPTASNGAANTPADTAYAFTIADFNYSDVDGDPLAQVEITALPASGTLLLNGVPVTVNQQIDAADIAAGKLTFVPPPSSSGVTADQFGFRVSDGIQYEAGSHTMAIGFAPIVSAPPPPPDPGGTGGTSTPPPSGGTGGSGSTTSDSGGPGAGAGDEGAISGGSRAASGAADGGQAAQAVVAAPDKVETAAPADSSAGVAPPSAAGAFGSTSSGAPGTAPRDGAEAVGARLVEPAVEPTTVEQQAIQAISDPAFREELDKLRRHQEQEATVETRVAGSVFAVSTSLSVGYVLWLLRGGVLLTSLLSSLPAWRIIDPLPVLSRMGGSDEDEDDDSLEELVERSGPDSEPGPDADADADDERRVAPRAA